MTENLNTNEKQNRTTIRQKKKRPGLNAFVSVCFVISVLAVSSVALAGLGTRWEWWNFRTGLTILKYGGYATLIAGVVSLVSCIWSGITGARISFVFAVIGLLLSLPVAGTLWQWKTRAESLPRIHDITTDTNNPPSFKAILPLRRDSLNSSDYGGADVAAKQRAGYPDIGPLVLTALPEDVFQKALLYSVNLGWKIVDANQAEGRIEATDTTCWFGFKDDIVIRIAPEGTGSRVDVRSVSRVGLSDVGTNAKRIQKFINKLR